MPEIWNDNFIWNSAVLELALDRILKESRESEGVPPDVDDYLLPKSSLKEYSMAFILNSRKRRILIYHNSPKSYNSLKHHFCNSTNKDMASLSHQWKSKVVSAVLFKLDWKPSHMNYTTVSGTK